MKIFHNSFIQMTVGANIMKITAKDVAAAAGVSVSAVSRAFRMTSPLAPDKRKRILSAASQLGYQSSIDQFLSAQNNNTISMVVGDLANPFYPIAVNELARALLERDMRMIVHAVPEGQDVDLLMRQVLDYRTDGVILATSTLTSSLAAACRSSGIKTVLLNRVQTNIDMMAVCCDNYSGARLVANRFINGGRKNISFIGGRRDTSTHSERFLGFRDRLQEAEIEIMQATDGSFNYQKAFASASELFAQYPLPDALFCANDIMAIAAIDAARTKGIRVPDDTAIIGFDDIPMAAWESYRLTTVRQPLRRMLTQAINILVDPSTEAEQGDIRVLQGEMMERDSG